MKRIFISLAVLVLTVAIFSCCSSKTESIEQKKIEAVSMERSEHARDVGGEKEEGEESGTELTVTATYDNVRNGAHLILIYNAESNTFVGTVANTTEEILERVRVEVHLSNGIELGPTTQVDLAPGEISEVNLKASEKSFEGWVAHPEVGSNEAGHGEEGGEHGGERGEHSGEEKGEHSREGRGEHQ